MSIGVLVLKNSSNMIFFREDSLRSSLDLFSSIYIPRVFAVSFNHPPNGAPILSRSSFDSAASTASSYTIFRNALIASLNSSWDIDSPLYHGCY